MFTPENIKTIFEGLDEQTKEKIVRNIKPELTQALGRVGRKMAANPKAVLSPSCRDIMRAWRACPFTSVRVVILAQDPFINPGEAHGLCFSVPRGIKIPPSTANIFNCLVKQGLIPDKPTHGNLAGWAKQGVLLINAAYTTIIGKSNAHADDWAGYSDAVIGQLSADPAPKIFILLGNFAKNKAKLVAEHHVVLPWGHPSPLNNANKSDNPKNFIYCDVFTKCNNQLVAWGSPPINWDPDFLPVDPIAQVDPAVQANLLAMQVNPTVQVNPTMQVNPTVQVNPTAQGGAPKLDILIEKEAEDDPMPPTHDSVYIFTDGGATKNGQVDSEASWAFYINDGISCVKSYGIVPKVVIPGQIFQSSNNRGELTAICMAMEYVANRVGAPETAFVPGAKLIIISDSMYSINCINVWGPKWFAEPERLDGKKNIDLIRRGVEQLAELRKTMDVKFAHTRGHKSEPSIEDYDQWFNWYGNKVVDTLCNIALGNN